MSYCPKCGNKVDESMTFCPRCGAILKPETPVQAAPVSAPQRREKSEKGEKQEKEEPEKGEKQEKGEYGFIGWLIGGLILIIIGFFAVLRISGYLATGMDTALIFLIIGVIVIIVALYFATKARRRTPIPPTVPAPV